MPILDRLNVQKAFQNIRGFLHVSRNEPVQVSEYVPRGILDVAEDVSMLCRSQSRLSRWYVETVIQPLEYFRNAPII
jgi:hypothetical protein